MKLPKQLAIYIHDNGAGITENGIVTSNALGFVVLDSFCKFKKIECKAYTYSQLEGSNVTEDLVAIDTVLSEELQNSHGASFPYFLVGNTFGVAKPDYADNTFAATRPFTKEVWLCLVSSLLIVSIAHFLVLKGKVSFLKLLYDLYGNLFGRFTGRQPNSAAEGIIGAFWTIGVSILILCYTSLLLSYMTVPAREKGIKTFPELIRAVREGKAAAISTGGVGNELLQHGDEEWREFGKYLIKQKPLRDGMLLKAITKNFAYVGSEVIIEGFLGGGRHYISKDPYNYNIASILGGGFKTFCCFEELNQFIMRYWEAGFPSQSISANVHSNHEGIMFSTEYRDLFLGEEEGWRPLTLSDFSLAFYVLIIGHSMAFVVFLGELAHSRWKSKTIQKQQIG